MPYFTFNDGMTYKLIENSKLIRKLNRKYNRLSWEKRVTTNHVGPKVYEQGPGLRGYRSEVFHVFNNNFVWPKWMRADISARCEPVIFGIGKVKRRKQTYFFAVRPDEHSECSRLWFSMDEGTKVVSIDD